MLTCTLDNKQRTQSICEIQFMEFMGWIPMEAWIFPGFFSAMMSLRLILYSSLRIILELGYNNT